MHHAKPYTPLPGAGVAPRPRTGGLPDVRPLRTAAAARVCKLGATSQRGRALPVQRGRLVLRLLECRVCARPLCVRGRRGIECATICKVPPYSFEFRTCADGAPRASRALGRRKTRGLSRAYIARAGQVSLVTQPRYKSGAFRKAPLAASIVNENSSITGALCFVSDVLIILDGQGRERREERASHRPQLSQVTRC